TVPLAAVAAVASLCLRDFSDGSQRPGGHHQGPGRGGGRFSEEADRSRRTVGAVEVGRTPGRIGTTAKRDGVFRFADRLGHAARLLRTPEARMAAVATVCDPAFVRDD